MTRGRRPEWDAAVGRLEGSALAKARLLAVLDVLSGRRTVAQAGLPLGLGERRLRALRDQALAAALAGLEPRPAGRPARAPAGPDARVAALEAEVRELRIGLRAAQVREEIALLLPRLRRRGGRAAGATRTRRVPAARSGGCNG